jgi:hypothetical protein
MIADHIYQNIWPLKVMLALKDPFDIGMLQGYDHREHYGSIPQHFPYRDATHVLTFYRDLSRLQDPGVEAVGIQCYSVTSFWGWVTIRDEEYYVVSKGFTCVGTRRDPYYDAIAAGDPLWFVSDKPHCKPTPEQRRMLRTSTMAAKMVG